MDKRQAQQRGRRYDTVERRHKTGPKGVLFAVVLGIGIVGLLAILGAILSGG